MCLINKKYMKIGNDVSISEYARIEAVTLWGKDKFKPMLSIGDNTSFEQFAHIVFASNLIIGSNCVFSSRVMINTTNHMYNNINENVMHQKLITKDIHIGNNCFVGMDVKIFPGVTIGENVIVGANSIVMSDLPSYTVCVGVPAKPIKKYNFKTKKWEKILD